MKRKLVNFLNILLSPLKISIYRKGFDMVGNLKQLRKAGIAFNTLLDIGASDGKWSRYALKIFPFAKIIGIEPLIERNHALKKLSRKFNNFDYVLTAAGDGQIREIDITVTNDLDGSSITNNIGNKRKVQLKSLDQIVLDKNLVPPFFLKFDTHGFEIPILNGAIKTLDQTEVILMEAYNFKISHNALLFHEMIDYLSKKGFRVYNIADPLCRPSDNVFWQLDLFFIRKEHNVFKNGIYN